MENHECLDCEDNKNHRHKLNKKTKITIFLFILLFLVSFIPGLESLNESFISYFRLIWWAVLLGLILGGVIDYFIPEEFIYKHLGQKSKKSLLFAVFAGFLLSACSHGILAISMQLYKKGASVPSVITFLLASPWANLPVTILLFGFFGIKAFLFILAAMIIALITGFIFMFLDSKKMIEPSKSLKRSSEYKWNRIININFKESINGITNGSIHLANMVLWWIIIGFSAAVLIRAYIPGHLFIKYFGPNVLGLILTLAFATIIEVCSEGSAPIAFEIFNKVGTLGNPFVFLMAGVITDYTEIGLIWSNIGRKTAIWLPIVTIPQVLIVGYLFNIFL